MALYTVPMKNRLYSTSLAIILAGVLLFSCNRSMQQSSSKPLKEGIVGQLVWLEGNLMPTIDSDREMPKGQPVQREVHVYELTKTKEAEKEGHFYHKVHTELVQKVMSDSRGIFKLHLPPGKYSIFVKEPDGLFANIFDGYGHIMPVEVFQNEVTPITIEINYMAAY